MAHSSGAIARLLEKLEGVIYIPWTMVSGCCRVEVENVTEATYDWKRLGMQNMPRHPSQADVLVVGGWISADYAEKLKLAYAELAGHRYVVAVGACAISGSPYAVAGDSVIKVADILPVDVYVPGCPPRPEALIEAIETLKKKARPMHDQRKVIYEALKGPTGN